MPNAPVCYGLRSLLIFFLKRFISLVHYYFMNFFFPHYFLIIKILKIFSSIALLIQWPTKNVCCKESEANMPIFHKEREREREIKWNSKRCCCVEISASTRWINTPFLFFTLFFNSTKYCLNSIRLKTGN